jgi:hypothetical protein
MSGLELASDGKMYGTTEYGGDPSCAVNGCGTFYHYDHGYAQDAKFYSGAGVFPIARLTQFGCISSSCGPPEFVGVASGGGATGSCTGGCGTIFTAVKNSSGWSINAAYSFGSEAGDGTNPRGPLTEVSEYPPAFVGVTSAGGNSCNCGAVYYASRSASGPWSERVLHQFGNSATDGGYPVGGLVVDSHGVLYGATSAGGTNGLGTAFQLGYTGSSATESVIFNYSTKNGSVPLAGFLLKGSGSEAQPLGGGKIKLFGTASKGGKHKHGSAMIILHEGGSGGVILGGLVR